MAILVDTGPLFSYADRDDAQHLQVQEFLRSANELLIVPVTVLPEVCYLLQTRLGSRAELEFVASVDRGELAVESLEASDISRVHDILLDYIDDPIGFVDASIVAVAERLRITRLLTLDHRHFGGIRPRHAASFTLLP